MKVINRSGSEVNFDRDRIYQAIVSANEAVAADLQILQDQIETIVELVIAACEKIPRAINIEEIQDLVERFLMEAGAYYVAQAYIRYRHERQLRRKQNTTDATVLSLVEYQNEDVKQENSNKDPEIIPTQRDYIAGEVSKDLTRRKFLPPDIMKAHDEGIIHFHDSDYFIQRSHNCDLVNLEDMLQNGTVISKTKIDKPHKFSTACNIATQIVAQVASSQYGGQSISLAHLAPFVHETRVRLYQRYATLKQKLDETQYTQFIEELVNEDIRNGIQAIQYQIITLMTTNGQAPFVTVYMNLFEVPHGRTRRDLAKIIDEVLTQRMIGVKNEAGQWVTPAFPKLIYALDEDNAYPGSPYYYLTRKAAECIAARMVPDLISNKIMRKLKGATYTCMGCRSFLTPDRTTENVAKAKNWIKGEKYYGRFNQGVVTINLVDVALSSGGDEREFWHILDERLGLCYRALMIRHRRLEGTPSDVAPILWQYGALARLEKGETIDRLLHGGYSTISLGYAGLCECVRAMTGVSHTEEPGTTFAIRVMQKLNETCNRWKQINDIDFSLYGTPIESTTYKFAKCLQRRFGIVPGVTDKNYITNSYHVHVTEQIDAFKKLSFEAQFQELSPGGAISYVEVPNMRHNIPAIEALIRHIYDNIMYAEINTKTDVCHKCGYEIEIEIVKDSDGKLIWKCPVCGNTNQDEMTVVRRTCGYLGTNFWNQGRTQEIDERTLHL